MTKVPKTKKFPCAFCRGKGIQPGTGRLSCIVCKGSGRITINQPCSICKECGGRGRKASTNLYCLSCQGKGFIEESRYPSIAKSPVSKTRKVPTRTAGRGSSISQSEIGTKKEKVIVKKEKKSFLKKLLGTFKIL